MGFFDFLKPIVRGGIFKKLGSKIVKGVKSLFGKGGSKIVKGVKRGGTKITRGVKKTKAQIKAIPETVKKGKDLFKLTGTMTRPLKERISITKTFVKNNLKSAGKEALKRDGLERFAKTLQKNVVPLVKLQAKDKTFAKLLKNSRANEGWLAWLGRNGSKLSSNAKSAVNNIIREGAENIAVDKTMTLGGKLLLAGTSAAATAGTTAAIVESKK